MCGCNYSENSSKNFCCWGRLALKIEKFSPMAGLFYGKYIIMTEQDPNDFKNFLHFTASKQQHHIHHSSPKATDKRKSSQGSDNSISEIERSISNVFGRHREKNITIVLSKWAHLKDQYCYLGLEANSVLSSALLHDLEMCNGWKLYHHGTCEKNWRTEFPCNFCKHINVDDNQVFYPSKNVYS
ncbi:5301_t:CDS:2 [Entrophospora sp. SA101]|nr:5301_t:CDS:2 [Entrophospora sp. SA101]